MKSGAGGRDGGSTETGGATERGAGTLTGAPSVSVRTVLSSSSAAANRSSSSGCPHARHFSAPGSFRASQRRQTSARRGVRSSISRSPWERGRLVRPGAPGVPPGDHRTRFVRSTRRAWEHSRLTGPPSQSAFWRVQSGRNARGPRADGTSALPGSATPETVGKEQPRGRARDRHPARRCRGQPGISIRRPVRHAEPAPGGGNVRNPGAKPFETSDSAAAERARYHRGREAEAVGSRKRGMIAHPGAVQSLDVGWGELYRARLFLSCPSRAATARQKRWAEFFECRRP
jgi:hypothetical protein